MKQRNSFTSLIVSLIRPARIGIRVILQYAGYIQYSDQWSTFFRVSWDRQKRFVDSTRWKSLCHRWSREQPQPGSFSQRQREAEEREPGNEVGVFYQRTENGWRNFSWKCSRMRGEIIVFFITKLRKELRRRQSTQEVRKNTRLRLVFSPTLLSCSTTS